MATYNALGTSVTESVGTTEIDPLLQNHVEQLLATTGGVRNETTGEMEGGFIYDADPVFDGERLAEFNQDQLQSHELGREGLGAYEPYMGLANDGATAGLDAFSPEVSAGIESQIADGSSYAIGDEYLNPYQDVVIDNTMDEMRRQQNIDFNDVGAGAADANAFGGSRHGLVEAENYRNYDRNRTDALAGLNADNFTQAQDAQESHRDRQLEGAGLSTAAATAASDANLNASQTLSGLGGLEQQYGLTDVATLGAIGDQQQGLKQIGLDIEYDDFVFDRDRPYEKASYYSDIIGGVPSGQQEILNATTTNSDSSNDLAQILGGIGTLAGAGEQFGWWGGD